MSLRDMLNRDFDLKLEISGGYGQSRDDPIIVLNSDPIDASITEMHVLRAIGKGRGILWRTLARTPVEYSNLTLDQIKIETKEATKSEVNTQQENYYFDVSMAMADEEILPTAIVFTDERSELELPYELGWLHFDGATDNESSVAGFGQSIFYGAPGIKATVYVYDKRLSDIPSDIDASVVLNELEVSVADLFSLHPAASQLGGLMQSKTLHIRKFWIDGDVCVVALGVCRSKFIKLRLTYIDDPILDEVVNQSIEAFQEVIATNLQ